MNTDFRDAVISDYYSPQALATRMIQLDLQVANLAMMVKKLYLESTADHTHLSEIDALVSDLQAQVRQCRAMHEAPPDIDGAPV